MKTSFLIAALLATSFTPALAQDAQRSGRARVERPARTLPDGTVLQRGERWSGPARVRIDSVPVREARPAFSGQSVGVDRGGRLREGRGDDDVAVRRGLVARDRDAGTRAGFGGRFDGQSAGLVERRREVRRNARRGVLGDYQPGYTRVVPRTWGGWSREWRRDRRYDWQSYRYANRARFGAGRYLAPYGYGYGYRRYTVGIAISPVLFDQRYWIDDPYAYRLPDAHDPYRWVRYHDDVLLVDLETGQVVDAVYDFFG